MNASFNENTVNVYSKIIRSIGKNFLLLIITVFTVDLGPPLLKTIIDFPNMKICYLTTVAHMHNWEMENEYNFTLIGGKSILNKWNM